MGMSWAMTNADIPELINELITRVSDNKWVILFIINIILLIVGTFMDITPAILIFTPIFPADRPSIWGLIRFTSASLWFST